MKTIEKKIWSDYFDAVANGDKNFELRVADWNIEVGDTLILKDWDPKIKNYTGKEIVRQVTYVIKTKNAESWGMWPKEDIDKYGFQIIGFRPRVPNKKILVFTEGTLLMASCGKDVPREERVKQVINNNPAVHDFKNYIPVENVVKTLCEWSKRGYEIYYLTSRRTLEEISFIQDILVKYGYPSGLLLFRKDNEEYKDVAEKLSPDILIEDDCESIGGENEMTFTHLKPEIKGKIKHFAVKEFGGIDYLLNEI